MNWDKIEIDFPKAFDQAQTYAILNNIELDQLYKYNSRWLFDFFDKNKIYIHIKPDHEEENCFWWSIESWIDLFNYEQGRKNAETKAFAKAFEKLEKTINENINNS